jgi:hypothetical protein
VYQGSFRSNIYSPLPLPFPITADGERRKPIDNEVCRTKVKVTTYKNRTKN